MCRRSFLCEVFVSCLDLLSILQLMDMCGSLSFFLLLDFRAQVFPSETSMFPKPYIRKTKSTTRNPAAHHTVFNMIQLKSNFGL